MRRRFYELPVFAVAVFLLSFFWPGAYRIEEVGTGGGHSSLVRMNRFTGETEVFNTFRGWEVRTVGSLTAPPLLLLGFGTALVIVFAAGFAIARRTTRNPVPPSRTSTDLFDRPSISWARGGKRGPSELDDSRDP